MTEGVNTAQQEKPREDFLERAERLMFLQEEVRDLLKENPDAPREELREKMGKHFSEVPCLIDILRTRSLDTDVAEELLAMATSHGNNPKDIRDAINKHYVGEWRRGWQEKVRKLFASKQRPDLTETIAKMADKDFFQVLRGGLEGMEKALTLMPSDQAVMLLGVVPFASWRDTMNRLEKRWAAEKKKKR